MLDFLYLSYECMNSALVDGVCDFDKTVLMHVLCGFGVALTH